MIHVIATIRLRPGRLEDFLDKFRELVPLVLSEAGCIEYGPTIDLATSIGGQPPIRRDAVTVVEKWESVKSLEDHLAAPHMAAYRDAVKELVEGVEIVVLQPV